MALDQLLGQPLATPEWYVLCSKPEPGNPLGLSVRRADDVVSTHELRESDRRTFTCRGGGKGMGTKAFVRSLIGLENTYPDAFDTLGTLLRQIRPAAPAAAAPGPAPDSTPAPPLPPPPPLSSLAGATLLGRGRGGGAATMSLPVLRPRSAAATPSSAAAASPAAAAPSSAAKASARRARKDSAGTPPGFTYRYSVGDICRNSADSNRRVEISEVCI